MFDKGQKQSSTLSCDSSYFFFPAEIFQFLKLKKSVFRDVTRPTAFSTGLIVWAQPLEVKADTGNMRLFIS